jgi:hypothetical protein
VTTDIVPFHLPREDGVSSPEAIAKVIDHSDDDQMWAPNFAFLLPATFVAVRKFIVLLAIDLAEHDIEGAQNRRDIGEKMPPAQMVHRLKVSETCRAYLALIRLVRPV